MVNITENTKQIEVRIRNCTYSENCLVIDIYGNTFHLGDANGVPIDVMIKEILDIIKKDGWQL
jgi:hypothetical protein